jgi:NAD kinase
MALSTRIVLIHRRSEYSELLARHATYGQAEFFLRSRDRSIEDVLARHELLESAILLVSNSLPPDTRRARLERRDLDRFLFAPEDIVMVVGQDGLVANVSKYLTGQPVIGINPEPERNPGALVAWSPAEAVATVASVRAGRAHIEARAMVRATVDDGQSLEALNDLYVGDEGHQSSRYTLTVPERGSERHSSSGIIVGTGTGSTGWSTSIAHDRNVQTLPAAESADLAWFIREAWPSPSTGAQLTFGLLAPGEQLELVVESDQLVVFGDGIERDHLTLGWGQRLRLGASERTLALTLPQRS